MNVILKILIILVLFNIFAISSYYLYQNWPSEMQQFQVEDYPLGENQEIPENLNLTGVGSELSLFYPNMRFNHNSISYFINQNCNPEKSERMKDAFSKMTSKIPIITFAASEESKADILVGCSLDSYESEKNVFIVGEGGPTEIVNSSLYPIILKGKIILYNQTYCGYPVAELHELLHVFGLDHINISGRMMYPYIDCEQRIDSQIASLLKNLYSVEALPDLYFANASASKSGSYLDFEVTVKNGGMIDAKNVSLIVYAENEKVDEFELEEVEFGAGKTYYVTNLKLPSRDVSQIKFEAYYESDELNKGNNLISLSL